jgi:YfiH family protein
VGDADIDGFIRPGWDAPPRVRAFFTTRRAPGVSAPPYARCNLGDHVGDDPEAVARNRALLGEALRLPSAPLWLRQVHGVDIVDGDTCDGVPVADAARATRAGRVLAVMTADCLPLLLAADDGSEVAAVHAGWRGLAAGVIEATLRCLHTPPGRLHAWLGPAIGPDAFEVGDEVRDAFVGPDAKAAMAFVRRAGADGKWHCDLDALARRRLRAHGIERISGGGLCTFTDAERFHSHRRDRVTGRMAGLVWIDPGR